MAGVCHRKRSQIGALKFRHCEIFDTFARLTEESRNSAEETARRIRVLSSTTIEEIIRRVPVGWLAHGVADNIIRYLKARRATVPSTPLQTAVLCRGNLSEGAPGSGLEDKPLMRIDVPRPPM